jgi:biopolymer transport protein TolQ
MLEHALEEADEAMTPERLDAVDRAMRRSAAAEVSRMERYLPFLATTASAAPFIGLFGTVWGVMNSFRGMSLSGSAGIAAVAPGIAEALIATAAGLGAAIPAAIAYNQFGHRIRELGARMEDFSLEFLNLAERTFER